MEQTKEKRAIVFGYYKKGYSIDEIASITKIVKYYIEGLFNEWDRRQKELGTLNVPIFENIFDLQTTKENFILISNNREVNELARKLNYI